MSGERPDGQIVTDDYSWDTGTRTYRVFSLTEGELETLRSASWWVRRRIIDRVIRETSFPEPDEARDG